jgi:hypothetical protein
MAEELKTSSMKPFTLRLKNAYSKLNSKIFINGSMDGNDECSVMEHLCKTTELMRILFIISQV